MRRLFALLLALALLPLCPVLADEEPAQEEGVYALMTIPYSLFYEAETTGGSYDSVSSATRVKPLMMEYAGGSFHYMPDGREITGVVFPVYAPSEAMLAEYGGEELTAGSSVTITVVDGGKTVTATYTGADALFQSFPFSYFRLDEAPAVYKVMGPDSTFGPMQGAVIPLEGKVSVVENPYAPVCLQVEGVADALSALNVNAVVLVGDDGTRVGLKHVENIWSKTLLGFSLDAEVYALLKGRNIAAVELYTFDGKFVVQAGDGVRID